MARIASVVNLGFHPAPPGAIVGMVLHLKTPDPPHPDRKFNRADDKVLDPCSGEGKALVRLAEGLGVSWGHVLAVELNASRSTRIVEAFPDVRFVGPCSFESVPLTRRVCDQIPGIEPVGFAVDADGVAIVPRGAPSLLGVGNARVDRLLFLTRPSRAARENRSRYGRA
jgi:hypothetical protein